MFHSMFITFCILIASLHQAAGQDSVVTKGGILDGEYDLLGKAAIEKTEWSLAIEYHKPEYRPRTNIEVVIDVDRWLDSTNISSRPAQVRLEREILLRQRDGVKRIFSNWTLAGGELAAFLYDRGLDVPARFATKGGALSLIVTGLASENVFNTLRSTPRQRASKVLQSIVLPSLRYLVSAKLDSEISRIGICVLYGSKDFAEEDAMNLKAEMLGFVAPSDLCTKYIAGEITEDELVNAADIYLSDRDSSFDVKKIKLVLE